MEWNGWREGNRKLRKRVGGEEMGVGELNWGNQEAEKGQTVCSRGRGRGKFGRGGECGSRERSWENRGKWKWVEGEGEGREQGSEVGGRWHSYLEAAAAAA